MAITVIGKTTHGTLREVIEEIQKLHDEHGVESINVTFKQPKKPLIRLVTTIPGDK